MGRPTVAFCLSCGWTGKRRPEHQGRPCPRCQSTQVVLAGMTVPIPRDPDAIAAALTADPELLWQVMRQVGDLDKLIGPWTAFPKTGYWERATFAGRRVAWIQPELDGLAWNTANSHGWESELPDAMAKADSKLLEWLEQDWRLVGEMRRAG